MYDHWGARSQRVISGDDVPRTSPDVSSERRLAVDDGGGGGGEPFGAQKPD